MHFTFINISHDFILFLSLIKNIKNILEINSIKNVFNFH